MEHVATHRQPDRLLIIDPQQSFADQLVATGLRAEFAVRSVQYMNETVVALQEFQPDVIVLDTAMAAGSSPSGGAALLQLLAEQGTQAQILIVTHDSRRSRELMLLQGRSLNLQMLGHMGKSVEASRLEQILEQIQESFPNNIMPNMLQ